MSAFLQVVDLRVLAADEAEDLKTHGCRGHASPLL
jgi:hypothetical protein